MTPPPRILDRFRLDGKVAVVTGASRGLGRAIAFALADAGASLALIGREESTLLPVVEEIARDTSSVAHAFPLDVSDLDAQAGVVVAIRQQMERIDILVNNAGINVRAESMDYTVTDWDAVLNSNLRGPFFLTQACARVMREQGGGKVLNIVSMTSYLGVPTTPAYTASKAGLSQLTKLLAVEWAEHNIQVNAIAPGWFSTEMTAPLEGTPRHHWILNRTPARRFGEPRELAGAALFLVSPAADFVTGHTIAVDGGILAGSDWRTGR